MLDEDANACAICQTPVRGWVGGIPRYYCAHCFEEYKPDIYGKAVWVVYLTRDERLRRRRRNRRLQAPVVVETVPLLEWRL